MVEKIISGGQTGADQGGWEAADILGLKKGGWMPKGYRTENGPRPDFTWATEDANWEYPPRTELNIKNSDGTIIFGKLSECGSQLTRNLCSKLNKPCFVHPWPIITKLTVGVVKPDYAKPFQEWLEKHDIQILNVAGNRESKNLGTQEFVKNWLSDQLKIYLKM